MASLKLSTPSCTVVAGSTGSGKSFLVKRMLSECNFLFDQPVSKILYCYTAFQPLFEIMEKEIPNITFHKGLPSESVLESLASDRSHTICVLDDLQGEVVSSAEMEQLFTVHSHHKNISVIFILQNIFASGKHARSLALQAHHVFILKSLRDRSQMTCLSRQIFGKGGVIPEAFDDVNHENKFPYLLIDLAPHSIDKFRLRSQIFQGEDTVVYVPKSIKA